MRVQRLLSAVFPGRGLRLLVLLRASTPADIGLTLLFVIFPLPSL